MLGVTSALLLGPCVTAPLAGALLYIAKSGDITLGAAALFALRIGKGIPLIVIWTSGAALLSRAGARMVQGRWLFHFMFLGTAVWYLDRLVEPSGTLDIGRDGDRRLLKPAINTRNVAKLTCIIEGEGDHADFDDFICAVVEAGRFCIEDDAAMRKTRTRVFYDWTRLKLSQYAVFAAGFQMTCHGFVINAYHVLRDNLWLGNSLLGYGNRSYKEVELRSHSIPIRLQRHRTHNTYWRRYEQCPPPFQFAWGHPAKGISNNRPFRQGRTLALGLEIVG